MRSFKILWPSPLPQAIMINWFLIVKRAVNQNNRTRPIPTPFPLKTMWSLKSSDSSHSPLPSPLYPLPSTLSLRRVVNQNNWTKPRETEQSHGSISDYLCYLFAVKFVPRSRPFIWWRAYWRQRWWTKIHRLLCQVSWANIKTKLLQEVKTLNRVHVTFVKAWEGFI